MERSETILKSLEYVEAHIREPLNAGEIAAAAGYSAWHFSREFKKQMQVSVTEYVKRRRFVLAAEKIASGMKIIDAAMEYGYQSHSGFTRAFTKEFGFTPAFLKAAGIQVSCLRGGNLMYPVFMNRTEHHATKEELFQILLDVIHDNELKCNYEKIKRAYFMACSAYQGQKRYSGDDYVTHPINVAVLLAMMEAGEDLIAAGLLCDALTGRTDLTVEIIERRISPGTAKILKRAAAFDPEDFMAEDENVIMLKLAERLHNMRTVEFMEESRWKEKARETAEWFLPAANRLGLEQLAAELNALSVKYV